MEDIRIYDWDLNLLHIQHDITTANWTIYYNKIGTFEGHFPVSGKLAGVCAGKRHLIIRQGDKQAVGIGVNSNTEFVVFGRTLNWLFTKRSVAAFKTSELTPRLRNAEAVARWAFKQCYTNNETAAANDPDFILGALAGLEDQADYNFWRNTRNQLDDIICDALNGANAGHRLRIDFERKKWVFEVIVGQEFDLLLSEENRNAYDTEYDSDILELATAGWYEYTPQDEPAQTAAVEPVTPEVGTEWRYMENGNPLTGRYRMEKILSGSDESEARSDLDKSNATETIQTKMRKYKYGLDYTLGDTVMVQYKRAGFSFSKRYRVSGVNIWYGVNDSGEQPIMEDLEYGNTVCFYEYSAVRHLGS